MDIVTPEQADTLPGIPDPAGNPFLFGHEEQADGLAAAFQSGKMHHALLFTGPPGIGKATLAFHLAWHLLKVRDPSNAPERLVAPDTGSAIWRQVASGAHPGVLHLTRPFDEKNKKFKQVITVDEIRRVGRFLSRTAHDGGYRVVIIDSADDMNTNAANALLKNLEEPPRATLFILISHSPGRLLPTIRSRCQVLRFQPLGEGDLAKVLEAIGAEMPVTMCGRSSPSRHHACQIQSSEPSSAGCADTRSRNSVTSSAKTTAASGSSLISASTSARRRPASPPPLRCQRRRSRSFPMQPRSVRHGRQ